MDGGSSWPAGIGGSSTRMRPDSGCRNTTTRRQTPRSLPGRPRIRPSCPDSDVWLPAPQQNAITAGWPQPHRIVGRSTPVLGRGQRGCGRRVGTQNGAVLATADQMIGDGTGSGSSGGVGSGGGSGSGPGIGGSGDGGSGVSVGMTDTCPRSRSGKRRRITCELAAARWRDVMRARGACYRDVLFEREARPAPSWAACSPSKPGQDYFAGGNA